MVGTEQAEPSIRFGAPNKNSFDFSYEIACYPVRDRKKRGFVLSSGAAGLALCLMSFPALKRWAISS